MKTLALLLAVAAAAFGAKPSPKVPIALFMADPAGFKGDSITLRVRVIIPQPWHIQSDAPLDDFLIPTELKAEGEGLRFGKPVFPKAILKELPALGGKVALFEDTIEVRLPARKTTDDKAGSDPLAAAQLTLRYQACDDSQCLPPRTIPVRYAPKGF